MRVRFRTWQLEAIAVALVLAVVTILTGNKLREWIGSAAVFISFLHAQVSDRLAADQATRPEPLVPCHGRAQQYFIAKEGLWLAYFLLSQTWAALVGVGLFLAYPLWRRYYRGISGP